MTNNQKADIAGLKFQMRAVEKGFIVSKPLTETGCRYDYILDDTVSLKRVQVKYCDLKSCNASGSFLINLRSMAGGKTTSHYYTKDEIDLVIVYLAAINKLIKLEPEDFHEKQTLTIRYEETINRQEKNIHLLEKYLW